MLIKHEAKFAAGHAMLNSGTKCDGIHGHNYGVLVLIDGQTADNGMLLDFHIIDYIVKTYDHQLILNSEDPRLKMLEDAGETNLISFEAGNPTAENLAKQIATEIADEIESRDLSVVSIQVTIYEEADASATSKVTMRAIT